LRRPPGAIGTPASLGTRLERFLILAQLAWRKWMKSVD
jgi:hypothetical protein